MAELKKIIFMLILSSTIIWTASVIETQAATQAEVIATLTSQYSNVYMIRYYTPSSFWTGYSNNFGSAGYHVLLYGWSYPRYVGFSNGKPYIDLNSNVFPYHSYGSDAYSDFFSSTAGYFNVSGSIPSNVEQQFIIIKGSVNNPTVIDNESVFGSLEDYENVMNPTKKWWQSMWDWLAEDMNKPMGFLWFKDLIESVFDDDSEGTISENVTIGSPTLTPTPTPIPYTTVVIPKTDITTGETYYETNYYYVNPSGTPIITSYPPVNAPSNNGGGNGNQTYNPINGKPYSIPKLDWLSSVDIDGTGYDGIDSIGDGMSSIDNIGSEYKDGMSAVQDASGTLPTSWLLLIGIVASIPLLAGIVSRFLGG